MTVKFTNLNLQELLFDYPSKLILLAKPPQLIYENRNFIQYSKYFDSIKLFWIKLFFKCYPKLKKLTPKILFEIL